MSGGNYNHCQPKRQRRWDKPFVGSSSGPADYSRQHRRREYSGSGSGSEQHAAAAQSMYNEHASASRRQSGAVSRSQRRRGAGYGMKCLHNLIKRYMIELLCGRHSNIKLLDLACGRGGDIAKWTNSSIRRVVGIDYSSESIREARSRWESTPQQQQQQCDYEFAETAILGKSVWLPDNGRKHEFSHVSCMFALHYFCSSAECLDKLLETVAENLEEGGYFFGCMPDARWITDVLRTNERGPLRIVDRRAARAIQGFGQAYSMSIEDTVTSDSSPEYMAWPELIVSAAARYGLRPCMDQCLEEDPRRALWTCLSASSSKDDFRQFRPDCAIAAGTIGGGGVGGADWERVSRLFSCFIFRKDLDAAAPAAAGAEQVL